MAEIAQKFIDHQENHSGYGRNLLRANSEGTSNLKGRLLLSTGSWETVSLAHLSIRPRCQATLIVRYHLFPFANANAKSEYSYSSEMHNQLASAFSLPLSGSR